MFVEFDIDGQGILGVYIKGDGNVQHALDEVLVAVLALDLAKGCNPSVLDDQVLPPFGAATEDNERR